MNTLLQIKNMYLMLTKAAHTRRTYVVLKTKYILDVDEKPHFLMLKIKYTYVVSNTERHICVVEDDTYWVLAKVWC